MMYGQIVPIVPSVTRTNVHTRPPRSHTRKPRTAKTSASDRSYVIKNVVFYHSHHSHTIIQGVPKVKKKIYILRKRRFSTATIRTYYTHSQKRIGVSTSNAFKLCELRSLLSVVSLGVFVTSDQLHDYVFSWENRYGTGVKQSHADGKAS